MRKNCHLLALLLPLVGFTVLQMGCTKSEQTKTYTIKRPVYEAKASILAHINSQPTAVGEAGKIFIKDNYIFLNEVDKGVHIINNSNNANPVEEAFLNIPGNQDIAVHDNILYADMYSDLLAIDISDVHNVKITKVVNNFFTMRNFVNGYMIEQDKVITGWISKDTTVSIEDYNNLNNFPPCPNCSVNDMVRAAASSSKGIAGSMAKMILMDDHLFAITEPHSVGVVTLKTPASPQVIGNFSAGFDLETVYPFEGKLFLGSSSGMFMYDVSNPATPVKLGTFEHGRACDPVVTDGRYAYVTLRAGTNCGGAANELHVIDIKDLMAPVAVKTYQLTKPTGLAKQDAVLFVCDQNVVRIYDASEVSNLKQVTTLPADEPYDVILNGKKALVVTKAGLFQYDFSNLQSIKQLSVVKTGVN